MEIASGISIVEVGKTTTVVSLSSSFGNGIAINFGFRAGLRKLFRSNPSVQIVLSKRQQLALAGLV